MTLTTIRQATKVVGDPSSTVAGVLAPSATIATKEACHARS
jgi:hypothetical protein